MRRRLWAATSGASLPPPYTADAVEAAAQMAFDEWSGLSRLLLCAAT